MQRVFFLLTILSVFEVSCVSKTTSIKKHFLLEDSLPKDVLKEYMQKTGLHDISNGADSFEIRKWYPFYYSDSFPVCLERLYVENGVVKGEYFLFSNKAGTLILTNSYLADIRVEKYEFSNISKRFFDSLYYTYNISNIDSFGMEKIRKVKSYPYTTINYRNVFYEQATKTDYYGTFITDPNQLPGVSKELDKYAAFSKFTYDSICLSDTGFRKWLLPRLNRIYGIKPPGVP